VEKTGDKIPLNLKNEDKNNKRRPNLTNATEFF
jgi:hypothetical protein